MNEDEALELTGINDLLLATDRVLDWVDLVLCTTGADGFYMAGYTESTYKRETQHSLLSGGINEFNRYEFSRVMRKKDCQDPFRIYSHIESHMGGQKKL